VADIMWVLSSPLLSLALALALVNMLKPVAQSHLWKLYHIDRSIQKVRDQIRTARAMHAVKWFLTSTEGKS